MSKLSLFIAASLVANTNVVGQPAVPSTTESQELLAACNEIKDSTRPKRKTIKACETLDEEGRLALVEADAVVAYRRYQDDVRRREAERQSSPRGQSRK